MVYGMALGAAPVDGAGGNEGEGFGTVCRAIPLGKSVCVLGFLALVLTSRSPFIPQMRSGLSARRTLNQICYEYQPGGRCSRKTNRLQATWLQGSYRTSFRGQRQTLCVYPSRQTSAFASCLARPKMTR